MRYNLIVQFSLHYVLAHSKKLSDSTFKRSWRVAGDTMFNSVTVTLNLKCKNFEQYCEITGDGLKVEFSTVYVSTRYY